MRAARLLPVFVSSLVFSGACGSSGPGGTIQFTTSGEVLALGGYSFPPPTADDPAFADGWEIRFQRMLVTIDKLTLSEDPDTSPTDQSRTGKKVAELTGPWAVDLHAGGPLTGKGGADEQALPIATLDKQNLNGDEPFDDTRRYAFGYDLVAASASAQRLGLDASDADYAEMIAKGYAVFFIGTATWKGTGCTSTAPGFDFDAVPKQVKFRLGFTTPTTYVNCQNPDNDPADPLGGEEHQRGIQVKASATTVAQVTAHSDHIFWESVVHDSPAHFDPYAALAKDVGGEKIVTTEDTVGVDYTAFKLGAQPLPWRTCLDGYTPPNTSAQMGFDSGTIPHSPSGDRAEVLRDFHDYLAYNQSTFGHLNSDGLCAVKRQYPSPP